MGHEIIRSPSSEVPTIWSHLVSAKPDNAFDWIVGCLGLPKSSTMAQSIRAATDLGIVIPRKKRDRRIASLWTLAVMYTASRALLFSCPDPTKFATDLVLPGDYLNVVANLGALRFHQSSGDLVWPAGVRSISSQLCVATSGLHSDPTPYPFYDHHTGDFDCWLDCNFSTAFVFNHESSQYYKYCDGGFSEWMHRRFSECLSV